VIERPDDIFDREKPWAALSAFATSQHQGARFGIVYGRRRQGKSWLLERLARAARGFYWEAFEGSCAQQLAAFGFELSLFAKSPAPFQPTTWESALDLLWKIRPPLVVLDEFQYLVSAASELPSLLQIKVSRAGGPPLLACGSALGPMQRLLAAEAPLRGRAMLELVVGPFDFRTAARYWNLGKRWETALRLHAIVGGTPAYKGFSGGRAPADGAMDTWIETVLLDPSGALFREGRILASETSAVDRGLYQGILSAVAAGNSRRGQIAAALGRPENTLAHALNALVDLALLERVEDPLRTRRAFFRFAEPMLRAYQTLIAPYEGAIERRGARSVMPALQAPLLSQIEGPHFEHLAREWMHQFASEETLGGMPTTVGASTVGDKDGKRELEVDAVACVADRVIAIAEAKWTATPVGLAEFASLELRRTLLRARTAQACKLLLFARSGFTPEVRALAKKRADLELVDLPRLYTGD
jgi:uncharacterized protein